MTIVNQYRVRIISPPSYALVWGTTSPSVGPNGEAIDTSLTVIVQSITSSETTIDNFPFTSSGSITTSEMLPILQVNFVYGIQSQVVRTRNVTGLGSVTNPNNKCLVSTGAAVNSSITLESITPLKYRTGEDLLGRFSGTFTQGVAGSSQLLGAFDEFNGLGFGYNGADFGVFHRNNSVTTWIPQTSWNIDPFNGSGPSGANINFGDGFGNVFQLIYRYHGFGSLYYYVENPADGLNVLVHTIRYENTSELPNFSDPTFPLAIQVNNTTNNTNIATSSAGFLGAVRGLISTISDPIFVYEWTGIVVGNGTEGAGFSLRFPDTFNGKQNRVILFLTKLSSTTNANDRPQRIRIRKNATFSGAVWTDYNAGNSVVQILTGGTWNVGTGQIISVDFVAGGGIPTLVRYESGSNNNILGLKNDTFTFTFQGEGGAGVNGGSITWLESQ